MKKNLLISASASVVFAAMLFVSCGKDTSAITDLSLVEDVLTIQAFKDEMIPEEDLNKIIDAGINAQSAINKQPWHFSVVTDKKFMTEIGEKMKANMPKKPMGDDMPAPPPMAKGPKAGMGDSPVAIIISARDGGEYDAGLATELMTIEAVLLGYGTKIISSPSIVLNGEEKDSYKAILGIPEDMSVRGVILIGKYDKNLDGITTASTRNEKNETVTYIK